MLKRTIRSIRRKPKAVRDQYAFWIAATFTSLIVLGWVITIPDRFGDTESADVATSQVEQPDSITDAITEFQSRVDAVENEVQALSSASSATATPTTSTPAAVTNLATAPEVRIATFSASSAAPRP